MDACQSPHTEDGDTSMPLCISPGPLAEPIPHVDTHEELQSLLEIGVEILAIRLHIRAPVTEAVVPDAHTASPLLVPPRPRIRLWRSPRARLPHGADLTGRPLTSHSYVNEDAVDAVGWRAGIAREAPPSRPDIPAGVQRRLEGTPLLRQLIQPLHHVETVARDRAPLLTTCLLAGATP